MRTATAEDHHGFDKAREFCRPRNTIELRRSFEAEAELAEIGRRAVEVDRLRREVLRLSKSRLTTWNDSAPAKSALGRARRRLNYAVRKYREAGES